MLRTSRYCYVRLSVITLRYRDHIGWKSSKIISPLVSQGCSLFADPNVMDLLQGENLEILALIGVGTKKVVFGRPFMFAYLLY